MRKRERLAEEKRKEREECFQKIKTFLGNVFLDPLRQNDLQIALIFPNLEPKEQKALYYRMVKRNAECCLNGHTALKISAEFQCDWLVKMVDYLPHARRAAKLAVRLYRKVEKPTPDSLRKWSENQGEPPSKLQEEYAFKQHWTATRDHIIVVAIEKTLEKQERRGCKRKLSLGRAPSQREDWKTKYSICRAVVEVLKERYGGYPQCHLPTYDMVWNAWQRYVNQFVPGAKRRGGRPLLPPGGLYPVINPPGIDTEPMQREFRERSEDHLRRCAQRDLDDDSE